MERWRIVKKEDGFYYVQQCNRFLFWKFWTDLDCFGEPVINKADAMKLRTVDDAKYALNRRIEHVEKKKKPKLLVIEEVNLKK